MPGDSRAGKERQIRTCRTKPGTGNSLGSVEARRILRKLSESNAEAEARMKELSGFSFDDLQDYKELMQSKKQNN